MTDADNSFPGANPGVVTPLVSVIVAAFNAERFIEETCRSALAQTYPALEVIVVDDGSIDGTAAVVAALARSDKRLRLIRQANLGVAAARNKAIAAANGEFLAPLDADDLWDPTKISRQVSRMLEAGEDTGLVYCWWAWIDTDNVILDRSPRWRIEGRILQRLVEINVTGSASVPLFRRSTVERLGAYRSELRASGCQGCEDWDLVLRVAEHCHVAVVPEVLVGYRRSAESMSSDYRAMWRSRHEVMSALAARQASISREILRRSRGQFALHIAGMSFWSRDYLKACRWGLRSRPLNLLLAVLPHVFELILRRWMRSGPVPQRLVADRGNFERHCPADPQIPYDRIYARHWHRHDRG
ncbi:glycosyltransferase family 2 protein [Thermomonas carbonis]|uniref:Glycosyltransferase family 2 protein n=1 Tax=Thermomonas carbonis TaxID=1463158 RepID=A0A7G9SMR5_9GAMM|nr:glycosyltransferase family 2 protein [Thermomonas carbonis]QNN69140.1 glycosyltransferase family 2 protein [Thermomonas carbonis]GHC06498.1 glycosyl transferase [Thermomonas carbonis]